MAPTRLRGLVASAVTAVVLAPAPLALANPDPAAPAAAAASGETSRHGDGEDHEVVPAERPPVRARVVDPGGGAALHPLALGLVPAFGAAAGALLGLRRRWSLDG